MGITVKLSVSCQGRLTLGWTIARSQKDSSHRIIHHVSQSGSCHIHTTHKLIPKCVTPPVSVRYKDRKEKQIEEPRREMERKRRTISHSLVTTWVQESKIKTKGNQGCSNILQTIMLRKECIISILNYNFLAHAHSPSYWEGSLEPQEFKLSLSNTAKPCL